MEKPKRGGKRGCRRFGCLSILAIGLLLYFGSGADRSQREPSSSTQNPTNTQTSNKVITAKGTFNIPGTAVMDGRDLEAAEPTIVTPINIWDNVPRNKVVCQLNHGDRVELLDAKWVASEERYYFQVKNGNCNGWVSEPFIGE